MSWDFETEPEFQEKLDWLSDFVREEVEPLEHVLKDGSPTNPLRNKLIKPLQEEVKKQKLWACHLGANLGGQGYGQVKLGLMNEILGRARWAPTVFGCQAPDTGNAEILAHYGTPAQKEKYLQPLLNGDILSCFSMTEPQGGADPKVFQTKAVLEGDEWVINGHKWFSSNAKNASFLIVMVVTEPDAPPYQQQSMILVPKETPGVNILRNVGVGYQSEDEGSHAYIHYDNVRVPKENLLGERGQAFAVAQTRLGGGRIHHAMRTIGQAQKAFDMMCERALSRETQGELLAKKQMVQEKIADSWTDIQCFRLLVLQSAWKIDKYQDYMKVRKDIAAVKAMMPRVFHDVAARALQVHGSLGVSNEMPFAHQVIESFHMALADGPTEVHKITVARQVLREYNGTNGMFPTQHIPAKREEAIKRFADVIESDLAVNA
ncbi:MAG: acyl-CoA dehydrogenase family protein [Alphaproteobacteria bacterium]